jgi:hypothetical protein
MSGSESGRSWKFIRSLEWALLVGALSGLAFIGLTFSNFLIEMKQQTALYVGIGIAVVVTAALTYILDQISKSIGGFRNALKGKRNK